MGNHPGKYVIREPEHVAAPFCGVDVPSRSWACSVLRQSSYEVTKSGFSSFMFMLSCIGNFVFQINFCFTVLALVSLVVVKKLAEKNVSEMTYFVSSGM